MRVHQSTTLDEYLTKCYENAVDTNALSPLPLYRNYKQMSLMHWEGLRIHWSELRTHDPSSCPGKQRYLEMAACPGYHLSKARDILDDYQSIPEDQVENHYQAFVCGATLPTGVLEYAKYMDGNGPT